MVDPRLDVHRTDDAALMDQRHCQQRLKARLFRLRQEFEAGIAGRIGHRHRLPGLRCPAGEPFTQPQLCPAHRFRSQAGGCLEDQAFGISVEQVDRAGVHAHDTRRAAGDQV
jgi:hypothetical protein